MPGFLGGSSGSGAGGEIRFPSELIDPVTKLRVSEPQTLIDTDFEYGLQPTKWETVELINNTPSFFSKSGDTTIPNIEAITTTATSREIKVTTGLPHGLAVGIPINVSGTKSLTADGAYIINSVPTPTTFTYLSKQNQPEAASIEDLYTSIVSGEFFQGSQIKIADSDGIVTDAQGASILTVKTESPHGFGLNTPFYFLNLNSTVSQEFDSSNTSSKAFDAANSSTAQVFDGSNTLTSYRLDLDNNAVASGTVSSISTFNPTTNQITVAHTTENFVGLSIGFPLYHNITTAGGYFASNPRGVVFLKSLDTSNTNGSIFTVSQVPNGEVIPIPNALTGTFQRANEARLFAGNNINTATETTINLVEESEKEFNATNTGGQFLDNCSFSGSNVTGASGSGVADLDLYQGLMVRYSTTGTPPTINAGGDASNGGSTTSLVNNRTYFIESSFQVGSSINYVTTLKEFPTSAANINFTSTGTGTHTFTAIGLAGDKDMIHLRNHGYVVGDMLRYTYPSGGHFGVNNPVTEEKDYYFVERLLGTHNFQVNFTIGELSPKLQEFIGLTATTSSVNVSFTTAGFTAPLTFAVTSGTLPSGLSLNTSTGAITGTPNAAYPQATVRITVTDVASSSDFADVTFQVNPAPNLYSFTTATFGSGGQTDLNGPNITQARNAISNPTWAPTYLNMSTNGVQLWTVPQTATYRIRAVGGGGGGNSSFGGAGAIIQGNVPLTQGQVIKLVVGQGGRSHDCGGCDTGGGGGSFVTDNSNNPLIIAGGGGGAANNGAGFFAVTNTTGGSGDNNSGGSNGAGGNCGHGMSGAGLTGNGCQSQWNGSANLGGPTNIARSFISGAQGGSSTQRSPNINGGFGGGASGHGNCCIGSGGAGGYSGGGAPTSCGRGGGGASFIVSTATNVQTSTGQYNGSSSFNGVGIVNVGYAGQVNCGSSYGQTGSITITRL
jgi:hypothetical protein